MTTPMNALPNLRHLRYLVALADRLSFRQAADDCTVSQSTLSAGIRDLENLLGVEVAERTKRSVRLTPAGRSVVERARRVLAEARALMDTAREAADPLRGRIELGAVPSIGPFLLPRFLPHARGIFPGLVFGLREDKTPALLARLNGGSLDLVLMAFPYDTAGLETFTLFAYRFLFVCHPDHRLAGRATVSGGDLAGEPLLLMERSHCLHRHAVPALGATAADSAYTATSLPMLAAMVAEGLGATLLPALAVGGGLLADHAVVVRPLADSANTRQIGLAWRPSAPRAATYRTIAGLLRDWAGTDPRINPANPRG